MDNYKVYAININPFIVAEAVEMAQAIYNNDRELLIGWADYLIDEATEAMAEEGVPPEIIGAIITNTTPPISDN